MRRPVKPFVTEYRGSTRRQHGQGPSKIDPMKIDPMKLEPDALEPRAAAPVWPQPSAVEDGYEAALRAADALFSGGRVSQPSEPAAAAAASPGPSLPGGGRVLRSLEEPPSEEMARLEAEFAPKKRGRKPGSKNKPKPLPPPAQADAAGSVMAPAPSETREFAVASSVAALQTTVPATRAPALSVGAGAPRGERYAWVRTRLKPGEQWKRRLPKVAW